MHRLAQAGVPVLLVGSSTWDPQWSADTPLLTDAPALGGRERLELWRSVLESRQPPIDPSLAQPIWPWVPDRSSRRSGPPRPRRG